MASALYLWILVVGTITTGALNSLFTKFQDKQCVRDCDTTSPKYFEQPVLQTLQMFVGELAVFIVYWFLYSSPTAKRRRGYTAIGDTVTPDHTSLTLAKSVVLSIPAVFDLLGTTLINIGLLYTPVSVYQMTRGSVVLFAAIFSVIFLKRRITKLEWISLVFVSLGVVIVGVSTSSSDSGTDESNSLVVLGMCLIVLAEVCQALQFVIEEHILAKNPIIPLQLVYYEGFYGSVVMVVSFLFMNLLLSHTTLHKEFKNLPFNISQLLTDMFSNSAVLFLLMAIMVLIAMFNFFGVSITHEISATSRTTVDTCRTLLVWIVALILGWESFLWLQSAGFLVLVFGTLCFNGVLKPENWLFVPQGLKDGRTELFANQDPLEHT